MRIAGAIIFVFGLLICLTIIGIPFGLFLMFVGTLMMIFGSRRTVITNVVQVSNAPGQSYTPPPEAAPYVPEVKQVTARTSNVLPPPIDITPSKREPVLSTYVSSDLPGDDFDRKKWQALLKYDPELAKVANKMSELGEKWADELARSYLAINDKTYLPSIVSQIIADARKEKR